jgi:hypothetical protein
MKKSRMKALQTRNKLRFTACTNAARLIFTCSEAARRARPGGTFPKFPAGRRFSDDFKSAPMNKIDLTCRGICRGKISQRNNQTYLEERTHPRQTNE